LGKIDLSAHALPIIFIDRRYSRTARFYAGINEASVQFHGVASSAITIVPKRADSDATRSRRRVPHK